MNKEKADMIIYTTEDGLTKVETTFDGDTVWLSIDQMAELFQRDRSVIGKHVRNIFKEGELEKESVWAKFAYTATDGKVYNVDYYNLDVIISVGYRVKSKRGTQFRIWATGILKEYMRKGFALDDDRLKNLGGGGYFKELVVWHFRRIMKTLKVKQFGCSTKTQSKRYAFCPNSTKRINNDGMKVSNLYIAQIKQKHGIIERENYNKPKSEKGGQPECPKEKEIAIEEALKYFQMIPSES